MEAHYSRIPPPVTASLQELVASGKDSNEAPSEHLTPKETGQTNIFENIGLSKHHPTLSFIVPVVSILAFIPAALAWAHSSHEVGTIDDADFYQLVSASAIQLLSILTLMEPTLSNVQLKVQAWFWTRILAGASTTCALTAIPLYLLVPTEWSAAVSFGGGVAQALVTLQLMFAI